VPQAGIDDALNPKDPKIKEKLDDIGQRIAKANATIDPVQKIYKQPGQPVETTT
jgi:hypothetical protein